MSGIETNNVVERLRLDQFKRTVEFFGGVGPWRPVSASLTQGGKNV